MFLAPPEAPKLRRTDNSPESSSPAPPTAAQGKAWVKIFLESMAVLASTEFLIMLALPHLTPHWSDVARSAVDTILLCGISIPFVLWRARSAHASTLREIEEVVRSRTAELVDTQARLMASTRQSQALVDAVTRHALVNFTTASGVILEVNQAFCDLVGWSREELVGKTYKVVHSGTHPVSFWTEMRGEIARGNTWRGDICNRTRDGRLVWMDTLIVPFLDDENGKVEKHLAIRFDITRRKQAELELEAAKSQAEAANEAKSAFLANMSHEIRTPMNGVLGMISVLLHTKLDPTQRRYAKLVRSSGESLLAVLNDILDFSKIEAGKLELESIPFDLGDLLEEIRNVLSFKADEKGIHLASRLDKDMPRAFRGDPGRLRQILLNLGGNALKFTEKGRVDLRVEPASVDAERTTLRFSVADTGIGISPALIPELFHPFIQADSSTTRRYGGTGLGLAICRQLVELMGGKIGVHSRPDEGSTFWFEIPLSRASAGAPDAPDASPPSPSPERYEGRILVAEDNPVNQTVVRATLLQMGLEVRLAEDGEQALRRLREERFDLVLMDLQMPVLNGLEACRRWREGNGAATGRDVPIVALTANARPEDREACLEAGMVDFLPKPFSEDQMRALLERWLPRA